MKVYLDNLATTPVDPRVVNSMLPYLQAQFGNPSSAQHEWGWESAEAVVKARQQAAALLGAEPGEIIFTSGATESNNLAIKGVLDKAGPARNHVITCAVEHRSVLAIFEFLQERDVEIDWVKVDDQGRVDLDDLRRKIRAETALISIMTANNEIGTLNNIQAIGDIAREHAIPFHTDIAQAAGKVWIDVKKLGISLASVSAHKFYGPKGIGLLYKDGQTALTPLIHGSGHEKGLRAGTLNVAAIVGLGRAAELCAEEFDQNFDHYIRLGNHLWNALQGAGHGRSARI